MAYTTPPTFADTNVLTATQLNTLSGDVEFLYSITHGMNIPFTSETMTGSGDSRHWQFRRRARYLHYKARVTSNTTDRFRISINGNYDVDDGVNRSAPYTYSGYEDLTLITAVPAVGDFYEVYITLAWSVVGELVVDYFIESNSTTL